MENHVLRKAKIGQALKLLFEDINSGFASNVNSVRGNVPLIIAFRFMTRIDSADYLVLLVGIISVIFSVHIVTSIIKNAAKPNSTLAEIFGVSRYFLSVVEIMMTGFFTTIFGYFVEIILPRELKTVQDITYVTLIFVYLYTFIKWTQIK